MITIPLIISVIGIILYFATDGKPSRAGEIMFFAGLLVTLFNLGSKSLI